MTEPALAERIIDVLRQSALHGSRRPISLDQPLGADGIGLNSLGLLEFTLALEESFGVRLPDEVWSGGKRLTLRSIAAEIDTMPERRPPSSIRPARSEDQLGAGAESWLARMFGRASDRIRRKWRS